MQAVKTMLLKWETKHNLPIRLGYSWNYFIKRPIAFATGEDYMVHKYPKAIMIDFEIPAYSFTAGTEWAIRYNTDYDNICEAENHALLADIMDAFKCIFTDAAPEWTEVSRETSRMPKSIYYGLGYIEGKRFIIKLEAPWPPAGCEIETKRTWSKKTTLTCATVEI